MGARPGIARVTRAPRRLAVAAALCLSAPVANAQSYLLAKLFSAETGQGDRLGAAVSLGPGVAVIGAPKASGAAPQSGAAHVFRRVPGGPWTYAASLGASDAAASDDFGRAVSAGAGVIIVGAPLNDDHGPDSGAAYIFRRIADGSWRQEAKLTASDAMPFDHFGAAVAINGATAVIGAPRGAGAAYIFRRRADGVWAEEARLIATGAGADDGFGASVAVRGVLVVVGAPRSSRASDNAGAAFVFRRVSEDEGKGEAGWRAEAALAAPLGQSSDEFGRSVAIDGGFAVVGAPGDDEVADSAGSAHVFRRRPDQTWAHEARLVMADPGAGDRLGHSVSISGLQVAAGAAQRNGETPDAGAVFLFRRDGAGVWAERPIVTAPDASGADRFGASVSILGDAVIVGAPLNKERGDGAGMAYMFDLVGYKGLQADCNGNLIADAIDLFVNKTSADCNDNGVPDECDIESGFSFDLNGDGVPDECEAAPACEGDLTGDGHINNADLVKLLARWGVCP